MKRPKTVVSECAAGTSIGRVVPIELHSVECADGG
jgi:hypothetical protein